MPTRIQRIPVLTRNHGDDNKPAITVDICDVIVSAAIIYPTRKTYSAFTDPVIITPSVMMKQREIDPVLSAGLPQARDIALSSSMRHGCLNWNAHLRSVFSYTMASDGSTTAVMDSAQRYIAFVVSYRQRIN